MKKLSFSLSKYNYAINKLYEEVSDDLHMQDDLLRYFPPVRVSHTGTIRWLTKPDVLEAPFKLHTNKASGEIELFNKTDDIKFKEFLSELIIPIRDKVKQHTIENINITCDVTGIKTDAENQNIWDAYIEAIEKIEMIFNNNGNPFFLIHPPEFYEKLSKTKPTVEQRNAVEEIFIKKREAYFLKRGSRKLVKSKLKTKREKSEINVDINLLKTNLSLPKYEIAINHLLVSILDGFIMLDPILNQIQKVSVAHDGVIRQVNEPEILETPLKDYSIEDSIKSDCFLTTSTDSFRDFHWKMLGKVIDELKDSLFETTSQVCEVTGNSVDGKNKNLWDAYNEMLETVEMIFDKNGNHNTQFVVSPEIAEKIRETPPTPEQMAKGKEIIERKKQEYYAQKRTRRLFKFNN